MSCAPSVFSERFSGTVAGFRIDLREDWHSDEGRSGLMVRRPDDGWLEGIGSWALVHGENSTRFRVPRFDELGKDAGESGVLVRLSEDSG